MSVKRSTLDKLTDKQKSLLTQFAYINYDIDKYEEIVKNKKITISELETIIKSANIPYLGNVAKKITGIQITPKEIMQEIKDSGLGNLEIKEILQDRNTGFFAVAIKDENENKGMIFRGTEVSNIRDLITDSITDAKEYIVDDAMQVQQAKQFYDKNKSEEGLNYLYGHSLGGNLVEHIYLKEYEDVKNAFVINPNHINQDLISTEEQIQAFNNQEKFNCVVTGGDWVSELKECDLYKNNIRYIENNKKLKNNILSEHAIETATFDKEGNFKITTKEQAYRWHRHNMQRFFTKAIAKSGNVLKNIYGKLTGSLESKKEEIKALPEGKKERNIREDYMLENFKTEDRTFDVEKAYKNLSTIVIKENNCEKNSEEKVH